MKESGMKKLLELLNECRAEHDVYPVVYDEKDLDSLWILKRFVKWLVENDKIDLEKLDEKAERKPQYTFIDDDGRLGFKLFEVYESLLILLSISDTPIEDLISYLK